MPVTAKKIDASTMDDRKIAGKLAERLAQHTKELGLTDEQLMNDAIEAQRTYRNERRSRTNRTGGH